MLAAFKEINENFEVILGFGVKSNPLFSKILGRTEISVVLIVELWICAFFFSFELNG